MVKALRYGLQSTRHERAEVMARTMHEMGCCVRLTHVPPEGERAQSASAVLQAYKAQHRVEQHVAVLHAPLLVNSLFLKKPERIAALGLVFWLALRLWRLVERALRVHVETTGSPWTGWDKQATPKPTAGRRMTKVAAVMVLKVGGHRQLADPLSTVQPPDLLARRVPAASFPAPQRR